MRSKGWKWLFRQGTRYVKILLSAYRGRTLTGPVSAVIALTYRCNLSCVMCDYPNRVRPDRGEMTTGQIKSLLDEIAALPVSGVSFYGGEPLLRTDLIELIEYARQFGLMIHLNTNGYLLDPIMAERIIGAGVDIVSLSLDGATPETHDRQRRREGAFDKVIDAIGHLRAARKSFNARTKIAVTATITPCNIEEIIQIVELARRIGADCVTVFEAQELETLPNAFTEAEKTQLLRINTALLTLKKKYPDFIDNSEAYLQISRKILRGEETRLKCFAPYTDIFFDPYGKIYPCDPLLGRNKPFGAFRPGQLKDFWYSKTYQKKRDRLSNCGLCNHLCHRELSLVFNKLWFLPRPRISPDAINTE
ncbi:MAG: radical SAM protein [Candidatus Erginobacter occultus]|nr:radical SAM protein [Candidatus Erginobacter occultus]